MKITKKVGKKGNAFLYRFRQPPAKQPRKRRTALSAIALPSLPVGPISGITEPVD